MASDTGKAELSTIVESDEEARREAAICFVLRYLSAYYDSEDSGDPEFDAKVFSKRDLALHIVDNLMVLLRA